MIETGIDRRIKVQDIIPNQLPKFILDESPLTVDFLQQYYISQEHQGGSVDIAENIDQYLNVDNLTPDVVIDSTITSGITTIGDETINVTSTKGFPNEYGLFKIDDEIITYTGSTTNSFTGCVRGFSGITSYHQDLNQEELIFSDSSAEEHTANSSVQNLSSLFLKEFYKKIKYSFTPGLENVNFTKNLDVGNFIKKARSLYQTKGTDESFRILFNVLYNETPKVVNLEEYLIKPSSANFVRRQVAIAEVISGNPLKLKGQTLFRTNFNKDINASISEIESFTRNNKQYFKFSLFLGYDNYTDLADDFIIIPSTKSLENVAIGASTISVDSTIGFGNTGTIVSGINTITYTDKSVNQFLNCSWLDEDNSAEILPIANIRDNQLYFGYEDGDIDKKVELRFTGVLSKFEQEGYVDVDENDIISVKYVGDKVSNSKNKLDRTFKEIFANSWIYNTSSSYHIKSLSGIDVDESIMFDSEIDRSSLKYGDRIEITDRGTGSVVYPLDTDDIPYVSKEIEPGSKSVSLENFSFSDTSLNYNLRRKLNKASSLSTPLEFNDIISDTQNVYFDNEYGYAASNSLPSYHQNSGADVEFPYLKQIDVKLRKNVLDISSNVGMITDLNSDETYSSIVFDADIDFITGDQIHYQPTGAPLVGLETGTYSIEKITSRKIRLYGSNSGIGGTNQFITFNKSLTNDKSHNFTLYSQKSGLIGPQKLFKKFPLKPNLTYGIGKTTDPGGIGMLINGVEISNYKSTDKVYYGPLTSANVLNGGENFDVINTPKIVISDPTPISGSGTTALIQPVVQGNIKEVFVDSQDFDIEKIISIGVTGGNGTGCVLEPILTKRYREVFFDGRQSTVGGGINTTTDTVLFTGDHGFVDGQEIIYDSNGSNGIGFGNTILSNDSLYYAKKINNRTIKLFPTSSDYASGINTIDFNGENNSGLHKFKVGPKNTLSGVSIIHPGKNYTNRKLLVKPSGISTAYNRINFNEHGFKDGELIEYSGNITGLSTTNEYYITNSQKNSFRLSDAGVGGTNRSNYDRENYVSLLSHGSGYQQFKYKDISVYAEFLSVGVGATSISITPVVRGSIIDAYLYETGTGYGSTIINFEKKPSINVLNGRSANINPLIIDGKINAINIQYGGKDYFTEPDLIVIDPTGLGNGAKLRPVIENGQISDVKIINAGIGYSTSSSILVKPLGSNEFIDLGIRSFTIDNNKKLGKNLLVDGEKKLKYTVCGYSTEVFNDGGGVSDIIGWAYDGNPIYGPYAYKNQDQTGGIVKLNSGYSTLIDNDIDREALQLIEPFKLGYFIEDYKYDKSGDLDEHNGRYEINQDFPNGVYAYHALVDNIDQPVFPYFIGNSYRSNPIDENFLDIDQSIDIDKLNVKRNTFPYKVNDLNADNDFLIETNEIEDQKISIESVSSGSITGFNIVSAGSSFKVNDDIKFDNTGTEGSGLIVKVSRVNGPSITNLDTSIEEYTDAILTWSEDEIKVSILPRHDFNNLDNIILSGLSTDISLLNSSYTIGFTTETARTLSTITPSIAGYSTDLYVNYIPKTVSIGSSISIGTETFKILKIYDKLNILTIERGHTGTAHSENSLISVIPDSFTISKKVNNFKSTLNDKVYFNPTKSVGIGTTSGIGLSTSFQLGPQIVRRDIPVQRIYLEDHPFSTNQKLTLTIPTGHSNISISTLPNSDPFLLPSTVYSVKTSHNTIGIKTGIGTTGGSEVYFRNISGGLGPNNDQYLLESNFDQVTAKVQRVKTLVSTAVTHKLKYGDNIELEVKPKLFTGIGSFDSVNLRRESLTGNILVNPLTFNSSSVKTDKLNLSNHRFNTGDKIYYEGAATGLSTGNYYVYRQDDNNIKLGLTYKDVTKYIPQYVNITESTGGTNQKIYSINPQLKSFNNNNLVFDISDSSLSGYNLRFYYDQDFEHEFVSSGISTTFDIVSTASTVTISYGSSLPSKLYYNLEKSGYISTSDTDVKNYSEIIFVDSDLDGSYTISGIGSTSFNIFLNQIPEILSYKSSDCDILNYHTDSKLADGSINKLDIYSAGSGYKSFPVYVGTSSTIAKNALIIPESNSIGNIEKVRFINEGFEYSSDTTLQPQAFISPILKVEDANTIGIITVRNGGSGYIKTPNIIIVNENTGKKINSGYLVPELIANSLSKVLIKEYPTGLPDVGTKLVAINNTNGVSIDRVESSVGTAFTCQITTPVLDFAINPFNVGDKVFIEGIQGIGTEGTGFNSEDYGYQFFTIDEIVSTNPFKFKIDLVGLTTNVGLAKTVQDSYGTIVNQSKYPFFDIHVVGSEFAIGEQLIVDNIERDLYVSSYSNNIMKISGTYTLTVGEVVTGKITRNTAKINQIQDNIGHYVVDFAVKKDIGWNDDIGKLSVDNQVIPDNDYYQNLSYAVKSSIQWKDLQTPVNNILHTSGMKNFSDTGISSTANVGFGVSNLTTVIYDVIEESRVDSVHNLDLARDTDVLGKDSRYIQFKKIRLSDYIDCQTNEVLVIDKLDKQFSNLEGDPSTYLNLDDLIGSNIYDNYIVRVESNGYSSDQLQLSELIVMSNGDDKVLFDKSELINSGIGFTSYLENVFGSFSIVEDKGLSYLRFLPNNPNDIDYDLKVVKSTFTSSNSGIATESLGAIDLTSSIVTPKAGLTSSIISVPSNKFGSLLINSYVTDILTKQVNFVESYVTHDGTDTYTSEYFIDGSVESLGQIGILTPNLAGNVLSINYENSTSNDVEVKSRIIGFGTVQPNGEFRFKAPAQTDGSERSLVYQGISTSGIGTTTIVGLSTILFDGFKSVVEVSAGASKAIHNLIGIQEGSNLYLQQSQYLSVGNDDKESGRSVLSTGLGTFGLSYDGSIFNLKFHPDDVGAGTSVVSFIQSLYTGIDQENVYGDFTYGSITDSVDYLLYNSINGNRINKKSFKTYSNNTPIFSKSFNPSNSNQLNLSTGLFNIRDHFFKTGEELNYLPYSSIVGVAATPMMYESTVSGILPSSVFAIRKTDDTFQIATTRALANAGTGITFTSVGEGNAHKLIMSKRNEKSVITIDGIAQYPIAPTNIQHTLEYNEGGEISAASTIFSLSGISSVTVGDLLKIDDEYTGIINVGVGTSTVGPITPGIGTYTIVTVDRGFVGSIATTHTDSTAAKLFKGNYNIVDNEIHFTDAPRGNPQGTELISGLPFVRSKFTGRVFLRNNYTTNLIYDNFSDQFTGVKTDFTLKVNGADTVGIGTSGGNGLLFINSVFQTPSTDNNPSNNFKIIEDVSAGVSTVIFSGVTSTNGSLIQSQYDINQNQLPRGGVIISLGSTPGLGYAPLIGGKVKPVLDASGTITNIVGVNTIGSPMGIVTAHYGKTTGILTVTTTEAHDLVLGDKTTDQVKLVGLEFTCGTDYVGLTTTIFPETDNNTYSIVSAAATNVFTVNVGTSTISHEYVGQGTVYAWYDDLDFGSGYNNIVSIGVTVKDDGYIHDYISGVTDSITVNANGIGVNSKINPTDVTYDPVTGKLVLIKTQHNNLTYSTHKAGAGSTYHGSVGIMTVTLTAVPSQALADGQLVLIEDESLVFTCGKDNHTTEHKYPRPSDPISGKWVQISNVTGGDTFEINVLNVVPSTNTSEHLFVSANPNGIKRSRNTISIANNALTFTCSKDNHNTQHTYPRPTDPHIVGGGSTIISEATDDLITINVGKNVGTGAIITANPVGFNTHEFISATSDSIEIINCAHNSSINGDYRQPASGTLYDPQTGLLTVHVANHGLKTNDTVKFTNNTVTFRCAQDNYQSNHSYPRSSDPVSNTNISLGSTTLNTFVLDVGESTYGSGGSLEYKIVSGGTNYKRPKIYTSAPSYENLEVRGISRLGMGETTDTGVGLLVDVEVNPAIEENEFFTHMFVDVDDNSIVVDAWNGFTKLTPNDASYIPSTGVLTLGFADNHNLTEGSNTIGIATNSIRFKCSKDDYMTIHSYPRATDPIHNLDTVAVGSTTLKTFTVNVGKQFTGKVGLGSELFQVSNFKIARNGYAFQPGDVFEPIGLVTDRKLHSMISKFELESTEVYSDNVALWQFGEVDFIDSIKQYQDGTRTRFPLIYNGSLISVESNDDFDSNLENLMVIMRNGVLQEPGEAYDFEGGTSINFAIPPRGTTVDENGIEKSGDDIAIFFYKGTDGDDATVVTPDKTRLEVGDSVQLRQNPAIINSLSQDERTVYSFTQSDTLSTNNYDGPGIITDISTQSNIYKPLTFIKKKHDQILNQDIVYKTRDQFEPQIYPTAKIIGYSSTTDNYFFVDDASLFNYENEASPAFNALLVSGINPVSVAATATIDSSGTVTAVTVNTGGSGYTSVPTVSIAAPPIIINDDLVGVGITALATATILNGSVNDISVSNPGLGYTVPPKVLVSLPNPSYEKVSTAPASSLTIQSNSGIVTGITTTMFGSNLAIEIIGITTESPSFPLMIVGNPLYVYDTEVGHGVTSMDTAGTTEVGIGTTFADNIYTIAAFHQTGVAPNEVTGIITCIIESNTNVSGLDTTGISSNPVGKYACSKISGFVRSSNPISIGISGYTINTGLTTFPTIQRRSSGWDETGAIERNI